MPLTTHYNEDKEMWSVKDKLLLGLSTSEYITQAIRNPFNWLIALIFTVGGYVTVTRFIFGLGYVTHSSYDYPWGLFLGWGLFVMVPLSASGFMLGTTVEVFGRDDFKPIERLALLNGLLGYFFAVVAFKRRFMKEKDNAAVMPLFPCIKQTFPAPEDRTC